MSNENTLQTIKLAIQDIVAPEVRELKAELKGLSHRMDQLDHRMDQLERRMDDRFALAERRMDERFEASNARSDAQFQAILAAIARSTAENELMVYKQITPLAQRIAALETARPAA
ncbi:hypothetical protein [Terriglobus sp.]|uniref:hypothetical protein n=1 Tax=Terriglobus sp. TaxID=1889013 RepID=UPI003B00708C